MSEWLLNVQKDRLKLLHARRYWSKTCFIILMRIFKNLGIIMIIVGIWGSSYAQENNSGNAYALSSIRVYENLMKSFYLRIGHSNNPFSQNAADRFEASAAKILVFVYAISEINSGREISKSIKEYLDISENSEMLPKLREALQQLRAIPNSNHVYHYFDVNKMCIEMISVLAQTIIEFTPYLNIREKTLQSILKKGLNDVSLELSGEFFESKIRNAFESKPGLESALLNIQRMEKTLTPPGILEQMLLRFQKPFMPQPTHNETTQTCAKLFR